MYGKAGQLVLEVDGLGVALGIGLAAGFIEGHTPQTQVVDGPVHVVGADGDVAVGAAAGSLVALHGGAGDVYKRQIQSYNKWAGKAENYWCHWEERLCPAVGGVELLQCGDPSAVEEKMEQLTHRKRSKRGYTDTERVDWIILGDILECACRADGLLPDNPLRAQARKCRERLSTVASRGLARRDLTENEVAALLDTCLSHPDEAVYDAMLLQLLTGLTVPELCGLTVGDWQRGRSVSWIEVTKAYKQVRGQMPAMTKLLDDANSYRKVVCTEAVEQVLHRLVARCKRQSRADRGAPLIAAADGTRLSPQQYKAVVRDVLDKIIRDGARLPFVERNGILRGENRPTIAHTDLLRNTAAYYFRMVCRCNDAERAAIPVSYTHQKSRR